MNDGPGDEEDDGGRCGASDRRGGDATGDGNSSLPGWPVRSGEGSAVEAGVMAISVAFTVLLLAYAGWQMATAPTTEPPEVSIVGTDPLDNRSVAVTVRLHNPSDIGLISATVESNCTSPPATVEFAYIPALSSTSGTLVCPRGTTEPSVSMTNWVRR